MLRRLLQSLPCFISDGLNICDHSRFTAEVDPDRCSGCGDCLRRCYFGALSLAGTEDGEVLVIDGDKCMGCGLCRVACPEEAITLRETREADFIPS